MSEKAATKVRDLAAVLVAASLATSTIAPAYAASGDKIGGAVAITNLVTADFDKQQRKLVSGDDVKQNDLIGVGTDSQGEIKLLDDTKLALGPGSSLLLDKFVYDSDQKSGSIVLNLTKGAFRFITGIAKKPTYVINTPNASITVRGTIFDVYILQDKSVWLLLHEGALEATGADRVCRVLDQPGQLLRITSSGIVDLPANWSKLQGSSAVPFDTAFPFVGKLLEVDQAPVLTRAAVINGSFNDNPPKPCVNPHVPSNAAPIIKTQFTPPPYIPPKATPRPVIKQVYTPPPPPPRYQRYPQKPKGYDNGDGVKAAVGIGILLGGGIKLGGGNHRPSYPGRPGGMGSGGMGGMGKGMGGMMGGHTKY